MAAAVCTKHPQGFTLLFMITTVIAVSSFRPSVGHLPPSLSLFGAKLDLTHRNDLHLPAGQPPMTRQELLTQMFARDQIRMMQRKLLQNNNNNNNAAAVAAAAAAEMKLISGADSHAGEYFVQLEVGTSSKVGTAGQKLWLVMDTGGDLTWMNCNRGKTNSSRAAAKHVFNAWESKSFSRVRCTSNVCPADIKQVFNPLTWCSRANYCDYTYGYISGEAQGDFARETITFLQSDGKTKQVPNMLVGCTRSTKYLDAIINGAHGIMGLGYSKFSLPAQTSGALGGGRQIFSYCLVDHLRSGKVSSKLIFGRPEGLTPKTMQTTEMLLGVGNGVSYGVKIKGIKINGKMLSSIPPAVWKFNKNGTGGWTIVDSGQTYTSLAEEAYDAVIAALITHSLSTSGFEKLNSSETPPFEHCYNRTARSELKKPRDRATLPRFEIAFEGGAVLAPPEKSYWIDYAPGTKCLGFVNSGPGTYAVIGNMLQQNHLFQFDVDNCQLSFARSNCD